MRFPTVDGHFWVVRDGKIIDPHFPDYDVICRIQKASKKDKDYLPAPELTQKLVTAMFVKGLKEVYGNDKTFEELCDIYTRRYKQNFGNTEPTMNMCFQNCLMEISKNGGTMVFGSLGFKLNGKDEYWYEYGGKNWTTVREFVK